jgi:hypothetical protein
MSIRICGIGVLPLALCVLPGVPAAAQQKQQKPNSVASLFEGLPADLRAKVKTNAVRRDRVNDWLQEHVNGKGKIIAVCVPAQITPRRAKDGTYNVAIDFGTSFRVVNILGDDWALELNGPAVLVPKAAKGGGKGFGGKGMFSGRGFRFMGVSSADAEILADLKEVTIQGKVERVMLLPVFGDIGISLILDDIRVEGKKLTPYKPAEVK